MINLEKSSVADIPATAMSQATKKHLRGSTLLLSGRVIAMVANFVVQILIVRYLSKSDYGAFAYVLSLISLGSSLAVFGFEKTVTRFIPMYQERGEYHKVFGSILMMVSTVFSLGLFLVLLVFGLKGWIAKSFISDPLAVQLLLLLIFLTPIQALDSLLVGMLSIFSKPTAIFFRRYVLGPSLRILVVLLVIVFHKDVYFLSMGFIAAGALGIAIYYGILMHDLRKQEAWKHFNTQNIQFPVKEILGFSIPIFTSSFVFMARTHLVVILLEYFRSTLDVAAYRAVQPVADLNTTVAQSFALLFMPTMARMHARKDQEGIDSLYWQSAIWITVISFPIFLLTFSLAQPLTLLLFGERYAQSGPIMAVLAIGYYFNAALGFNADTLRIYGRLRYTVMIDFISLLIGIGLNVILIPRYGAMGAAIGTCGALVLYNILNHIGLGFGTKINLFQWRYLRVYASIVLATLGLAILQSVLALPIYAGVMLAALISLGVLLINRRVLNIEQTFPELLKFRLVQLLLATDGNKSRPMVDRDLTAVFMEHIRKSTVRYFPGFGSKTIHVQLLKREERATAMLYRFKVSDESQTRSVFVKVPHRRPLNGQTHRRVYEKPLLYPKADPHDMHRLHYSALRAIYEYFTGLNRRNLGAICVLDYLPEYQAIFTEELNDPKLRQLVLRKNRLYSPFSDYELVPSFQNVGSWLSAYHVMPKEEDVKIRHAHQEDYVEAITKLTGFLSKTLGNESFFLRVASILISKGQVVLPESLPLGLGHGDFALRNILIGQNARVSVLDTFAKWRTPIYEDIGFFLNDLKMSYPQTISQGLAFRLNQLTTYEKAFLKGYFGQELIPYPAIRLYEARALLDKWASKVARSYQQPNFRKTAVSWLDIRLRSQYFKRRLKNLLVELNES